MTDGIICIRVDGEREGGRAVKSKSIFIRFKMHANHDHVDCDDLSVGLRDLLHLPVLHYS